VLSEGAEDASSFISNLQQHYSNRTDQERSFPTAKRSVSHWTEQAGQISPPQPRPVYKPETCSLQDVLRFGDKPQQTGNKEEHLLPVPTHTCSDSVRSRNVKGKTNRQPKRNDRKRRDTGLAHSSSTLLPVFLHSMQHK